MRQEKNKVKEEEEEEGEEGEEEYINYQYVLRTSYIINIKRLVSILVFIGYIFRGGRRRMRQKRRKRRKRRRRGKRERRSI